MESLRQTEKRMPKTIPSSKMFRLRCRIAATPGPHLKGKSRTGRGGEGKLSMAYVQKNIRELE